MSTREEWLNNIAGEMRPWFEPTGFKLPDKVRISVGWPSERGLSKKKRVIGQCWAPECSTDGYVEIFVSPWLGEAFSAAETTLHELIHGAGCKSHKGDFIRCARALGFTKPWTSTPSSDQLRDRIKELLGRFPEYPHGKLDMSMVELTRKKQTARMLKAECDDCGYTIRTSKKWLDIGPPLCPVHKTPMVPEEIDVPGEETAGMENYPLIAA